jgi:hypothetical protein
LRIPAAFAAFPDTWKLAGRKDQPDRACAGVGVTDLQVPDLAAGGAVQQGKDAQQRLVRVSAGAGGPPAEQGTLLVKGYGLPD